MAPSHLAILLVLLLATIQVVLAELQDGRYLIISGSRSIPPPSPIGFDYDDFLTLPVIIGGQERRWEFRKLGDYYSIVGIANRRRFSLRRIGDRVAVDQTRPFLWQVTKDDSGLYTITLPSIAWSTLGLAVGKSDLGSPVELKSYDGQPDPNLLWRLIPLDDFERSRGGSCDQYPLEY